VGRFLKEVSYKELFTEAHLLMVGKFLKVGQARKEGLANSKDFIQKEYGEPGEGKK
jgi:hypothetical protein